MIRALWRLCAILNRIMFGLAMCSVALLAVPTVIDVFSRLTLARPLLGTTEIVETLMLTLIFASLGYVQERGGHLRVHLLVNHLPRIGQEALHLAHSLGGVLLFSCMTHAFASLAEKRLATGETTLMLGIPQNWLYLFATMGLTIFCLNMLAETLKTVACLRQRIPSLVLGVCLILALCLLPFALRPLAGATQGWLGGGGLLLLLLLFFLGFPIGLVIIGVGYLGMLILHPGPAAANLMLAAGPYTTAVSYTYSVIPLFILMGELALYTGISRDMFRAAALWLGHLPGGLAIASVAGCAGFASVSGDSLTTSVTMAAVALPEMEKYRYSPGLARAALAAGGTLGILIPPSTGFLFYALITEESVGKLFVAGIIPGLLLSLFFCLTLYIQARRHPELAPPGATYLLRERLAVLPGVLPMLSLVVLIMGGIMSGAFSPTEGGAVGATGTALYGLMRGKLNASTLSKALSATCMISSSLLLILAGISLLSAFMAATALPQNLAEALVRLNAPREAVFACIVLFYTLLGCVMNVMPMIMLTLPAFFPAILAMGFNPVWFGVVVVIMMEMGQITPPVGLNVYAMSTLNGNVPVFAIFRQIFPFFLSMLFLIVLLTIFPELATWLPGLFFAP